MPGKTDFSRFNCSLARALGSVGDWWSLLVVREALFGASRFSEFQQRLGIAKNILAARLDALTAAGVLAREGSARRPLYTLTDKGQELLPALVALMQWGDKWESGGKPPVIATDQTGKALEPVRLLGKDGAQLTAKNIGFKLGPGADAATRRYFKQVVAENVLAEQCQDNDRQLSPERSA
ncbi:MAG: winged helix-turn-helix transcriptional regulator [Rhizobiaceae bacterium]